MKSPDVESTHPDPGEVPVLDWISKDLISVDPLYQRPLDQNRVDTILKAFSWRSFGALVVVPVRDSTFYHVSDGQHRLEAAKLHPLVAVVPAIIVQAEDIQTEAGIFVDINKNRKNVSALELFFAQLAAGDRHAADILRVCQAAGIRIPKNPGDYKPKDSIAVAAIGALVPVAPPGYILPNRAIQILTTVAAGKFRPITAAQIKAVEHLLIDPEFRDQITAEDLAAMLERDGSLHDNEAKRFGATHKVSYWKGLANVWFQKTRKRRGPASNVVEKMNMGVSTPSSTPVPASPEPNISKASTAKTVGSPASPVRTIVPHAVPTHRSVTSSIMGDPAPGRSALDARRAG